MNLQVFPSRGRGLGPGTSSQDFVEDIVSKIGASMAASVDLARFSRAGHDIGAVLVPRDSNYE